MRKLSRYSLFASIFVKEKLTTMTAMYFKQKRCLQKEADPMKVPPIPIVGCSGRKNRDRTVNSVSAVFSSVWQVDLYGRGESRVQMASNVVVVDMVGFGHSTGLSI
jgi:hypothetical protein